MAPPNVYRNITVIRANLMNPVSTQIAFDITDVPQVQKRGFVHQCKLRVSTAEGTGVSMF